MKVKINLKDLKIAIDALEYYIETEGPENEYIHSKINIQEAIRLRKNYLNTSR